MLLPTTTTTNAHKSTTVKSILLREFLATANTILRKTSITYKKECVAISPSSVGLDNI